MSKRKKKPSVSNNETPMRKAHIHDNENLKRYCRRRRKQVDRQEAQDG